MDPSFWVAFFGFLGIALTAVMSRQQHSETMKKADDVATKAVEASEINKELIVDNTNITKSAANLMAIKTEQNTKKVEVIAKAFNGELDERIQTVVREAVAPLIEARSSMDASLRLHSKLGEAGYGSGAETGKGNGSSTRSSHGEVGGYSVREGASNHTAAVG